MPIELEVDQEFKNICEQIKAENKDEEEWASVESSDMFQTKSYVGGFDETEMEFCFSYYTMKEQEYWFQLPLKDVIEIADGKKASLSLREAEK